MFGWLRELISTQEGMILYVLGLIAIAMMIDFLTGVIGAKINPSIEFISKRGIDGILRKIISLIVMIFFVPVAVIFPNGTGTALLHVLYFGYLGFEIKSIVENLEKMGIEVTLLKVFIRKLFEKEEEKGE